MPKAPLICKSIKPGMTYSAGACVRGSKLSIRGPKVNRPNAPLGSIPSSCRVFITGWSVEAAQIGNYHVSQKRAASDAWEDGVRLPAEPRFSLIIHSLRLRRNSIGAKAFSQQPRETRQINQIKSLFFARKHRHRCPLERTHMLPGLFERHRIVLRDRRE